MSFCFVRRHLCPDRSFIFLDLLAHLPFATVHLPFLLNSLALFYNFGKSWKSDPGIIKASEEQKKKVNAPLPAPPTIIPPAS